MTDSHSQIDINELDFSKLTELILPAPILHGDSVVAFLASADGLQDIEVQVKTLSPVGIEFVLENSVMSLTKGDSVSLALSFGGSATSISGVVVDNIAVSDLNSRITVRLNQSNEKRSDSHERRSASRWHCDEKFFPTAIASNPGRYNDYIYFSIRDLSRSGARAVTSLRNKFVLRGMRLVCLVSFPMVSQISMEFEVKNITVVSEKGKDLLSVGLEFIKAKPIDLNAVAQYLIQFGDVSTLEDLRSQQLFPKSIAQAIDYSFVRTDDELKEVIELRNRAYKQEGKIEEGEQILADSYDALSRIVIGKYRGKIVASARVFIPEFGDQIEQEEYAQLPAEYSRREDLVEVVRVCTHPDFRHSDLLASLLRFITITCIQAQRYTIVGCTTKELLPLYTRIGFRDTGITFKHLELNNLEHTMIIADARRVVLGRDVGPMVWNVFWRDTAKYLIENELLDDDPMSRLRIIVYKALAPLSLLARRRANKPRKKATPPIGNK